MSAAYRDAVACRAGLPGGDRGHGRGDRRCGSEPVAGLPTTALAELTADTPDEIYPTTADSPAFWLYTSGTTGTPKGAMHRHGSVQVVCETYGAQVLGITPEDRCLSAAKAFFAYGLGNSVLFPMSAGAAAVLEPSPARPEIMAERAGKFAATLFFAGPTFFSNMLRAGLPADALAGVRLAASAGEALPAALYQRWTSHFGVDILDGIGMTEMLHIFLSNRPGQVRAGTTGVAVPGYDLRVLGEDGLEVPPGTPGTLFVRGASAATGYWSRYDASRQVFQGEWLRTGDTYVVDADGYYSCLGRTGDMLKASGIWVSPAEVEARLLAHDDVAQAVVVAANDTDGLEKPVAFVLLSPGAIGDRGRADRVLPGRPAVLQAAPPDRVRDRVPDDRHRQDPPRGAARAGRGDHASGAGAAPGGAVVTGIGRSAPVAVVGAGTMGAGIAQVAAVAGHPVIVYDAAEGAAGRAVTAVRDRVARLVAKGRLDLDPSGLQLTVAGDLGELAPARCVIEAVAEDLAVKQALFADLEKVVTPDCVLATNTSSLSPTAIAAGLSYPGRLVGLHFFNPAPVMRLVEVVSGLATDPAVAAAVTTLAEDWGKQVVQASATPGFIVNRVARPFYAEALRLAEERAASPATIDAVLTQAGGFRMGPFALMDLVGQDVNEAVTRSVWTAFGYDPRFAPSLLQRAMVDAGWLGRKTGRGWFRVR